MSSFVSGLSSPLLLQGLHTRGKNATRADGRVTNCHRLATRWPSTQMIQIQCSVEGNEQHSSERKYFEEYRNRRPLLLISLVSLGSLVSNPATGKVKGRNPYDEKRLLEQNKRMQEANKAPKSFPNFVREGFEVKVVTPENYVLSDSGLFYLDIETGQGDCPIDGQQVTFHYVGYNESGRRIDSTYLQGSPAKIRLGNKSLVPGFEEGIRSMRPGGKRRLIIPPELGPPVGPSTFFSAKQFEVFDVELLNIRDCKRRTIGFYSDVICE